MSHSKTYLTVRFLTRCAFVALPFVIAFTLVACVYALMGW